MHRARATIDLDAIEANVATLRGLVAPVPLCVVVKADAYGHGGVTCAHAAVRAGADWLAVATIEEGAELRAARLDVPLLLLSEPRPHEVRTAVALACRVVVWSRTTIDALSIEAARAGVTVLVHLKVDTGMRRVGVPPDDALELAQHIADTEGLELEALMTHLPVADEPGNEFTARQLERFLEVVRQLERAGVRPPMLHAANSAGAIDHPEARFDLVRCGITAYGIAPAAALAGRVALRPALRLTSSVVDVRRIDEGEGVSYGHRFRAGRPTTIATVPMGYADGVPRQLGDAGGQVLIGGIRRPIVGAVTMDQCMVDCDDDEVAVGDEVVLLGAQGGERIDPWDWATALGTIAYEITTRIGPRVPRDHVRSSPTI